METADVVIIGGGVYGTSIAYHLAGMGCTDVILLEKDSLASGSSGKSCALIRQHYSYELTIRAAMESRKFFEVFETEVGGFPSYLRNGIIFLAHENEAEALKRNVKLQQRMGIDVDLLDPDELRRHFPEMKFSGLTVACYEPSAGYTDPHGVVTAFAAKARDLGAKICQSRAATGIEISGGSVRAVNTSQGAIKTEMVVNAAGPWGGRVGAMVGINLPLTPYRIQEGVVRPDEPYDRTTPTVIDPGESLYFKPEVGGLVLAGGGSDEDDKDVDPDNYKENADSKFVEYLSKQLSNRMPPFDNARFIRGGRR
jgi:sarcosine oxidase subunit beta